jgi:uncharacterized membrane protein YjjP (DUF1212 family)
MGIIITGELKVTTQQLVEIAVKAGAILLASGAEIFRVEDTITRICKSYNAECSSIVLPTGIFISTDGNTHQTITMAKRIHERKVDLHRIELINNFSRSLQNSPIPYEEAKKILNYIENTPTYRFSIRIAMSGLAGLMFTLLLKGSVLDSIAALIISMFIYLVKEEMEKAEFFQIFIFFISGIVAGGSAMFAVNIYPGLNIYKTVIGSLIILLPGVAITSGIKDALYGDIVSSLARLGEAVFTVTALGTGVGVMLSIGLRWV